MSHLGEKRRLANRQRPRDRQGRRETSHRVPSQLRQVTYNQAKSYRKLKVVHFKTKAFFEPYWRKKNFFGLKIDSNVEYFIYSFI